MIIRNIQNNNDEKYSILSASVSFRDEEYQDVYFKVSNKYRSFISSDATPFLAAFLLPCMKRGENILIEGDIDRGTSEALEKIMPLVISWKVGFKKIRLNFKNTIENMSNPSADISFFTGGVDSFYTYLKNKKKISHLLLINGCDITLANKTFFSKVESSLTEMAQKEEVELLIVETNLREIIEPKFEWEWELGSALSAISLFLRNGVKTAFIPAGMRYDQLCPYGTHPDFDPLWSTNSLKIIHDGCESSRLEKVQYISQYSVALDYLRVCCFAMKGKYNCNKCFKCMQTKIELACFDSLEETRTFDGAILHEDVEKIFYNYDLNFNIFGEEALVFLKKNKKYPDLQESIEKSLYESRNPSLLRRIVYFAAGLDKKYNKRRIYNLIFSNQEDRTFIFKLFANIGLIK